jgi:hypothetical protein
MRLSGLAKGRVRSRSKYLKVAFIGLNERLNHLQRNRNLMGDVNVSDCAIHIATVMRLGNT